MASAVDPDSRNKPALRERRATLPGCATVARSSDGWLTTPRAVLIGFALLAAAMLASAHLVSGRRRVEPLEWTEE